MPVLMCYQSDLASIQPQLYAFVKGRIFSENDANDIVQDSNQVLINKEDQYDPSYSFKNWAFGIAHWQMLAFFKRNKRAQPLLSLDIREEMPIELRNYESGNSNWLSDVPFAQLIKKERLELLQRLESLLSNRQKEIFNLLIQDLSNSEIAEEIGTSPSNVQSTKSRLIERMRNFVTNNKNENYHNY